MPIYSIPQGADLAVLAAEIIADRKSANARMSTGGVQWSGMGPQLQAVPTFAELVADLQEQKRQSDAWLASPEGRFTKAAKLIYDATGDDRLLACQSRDLDANHQRAAKLLAGMSGPAADDAREALTDYVASLLMGRIEAVAADRVEA